MNRPMMEVVVQEDLSGCIPYILDQHGNEIPCRESEFRILRIAQGLRSLAGTRFTAPDVADSTLADALTAIHDRDYLMFLERLGRTLAGDDVVMHHPFIPAGVAPDTPIVAGIFDVAREAARTAIGAASLLATGARYSYALCRPPGHHAGTSWLGGHCYLNNAVMALRTLRDAGLRRPALIDLDFHFGNGTAEILARDTTAFFGSIHSSTLISYPYQPTREFHDRQLFIPFTDDPGTGRFLEALALLLEHAMRTEPEALVISVGYDIIAGDPFGKWELPIEILEEIGAMLAAPGIPVCLVQEGGYLPEHLDECALRLGMGLLGRMTGAPAGEQRFTTAEGSVGMGT